MKAIVCTKYGSAEVLRLEQVEKPSPGGNEVLIKVHAASINSWDFELMRGKPFPVRLEGWRRPKYRILGCDVAGRIEAVGHDVNRFKPGDDVFGDLSGCRWGGFAEFACAHEVVLALKSPTMTFEQAAAVPQAAVMALRALRDMGRIQKGQKVLINGAGGGTGTFAVQLAKMYGAEVTGVDSTGKLDTLRSLGADHVIDFTREDFTGKGQVYDLILDVVTYRSVFDYRRVLRPGGIYVMLGGGSWPRVFQTMLLAPLISITGSKKMSVQIHKANSEDLKYLNELFETGRIVPVIDRLYPLSEVPEAFRYFGEGNVKGKLVITVGYNDRPSA